MRNKKKQSINGKETSRKSLIWEYSKAIGLAVLLALIIRGSVVSAYVIPTGSMIGTLEIGDQILVNKLQYHIKAPLTEWTIFKTGQIHRGDVVVFNPPWGGTPYIKRVIGLPGDRLEIVDKILKINGREYQEPYVRHGDPEIIPPVINQRDNFGPIVIPDGKLFVLGDNRDNSYDSRFWGYTDFNAVIGKAELRLWSWDADRWTFRWSRTFTMIQ